MKFKPWDKVNINLYGKKLKGIILHRVIGYSYPYEVRLKDHRNVWCKESELTKR